MRKHTHFGVIILMKKRFVWLTLLVLAALIASPTGEGKECVLNNGLELQDLTYWTFEGMASHSVMLYPMSPGGTYVWCHRTAPMEDNTGSLKQMIYVRKGEPYKVSADITYHNC
jgi:hypothetical protein